MTADSLKVLTTNQRNLKAQIIFASSPDLIAFPYQVKITEMLLI